MSGMKRSLLAAGAALALATAGTAASAQGWADGNLYVKGFGGASWPQDESADVSGAFVDFLKANGGFLTSDVDYETGYVIGVAVGYAITPNIAMELEYAYRYADTTFSSELSDGVDVFTESYGGTVYSNAVMVNALYRFDPMGAAGAVQPYLGAGLGGVKVDFDDGDSTDTEFAYQLMGGVSYAVNSNWSIYGEARWFSTNGGEIFSDDDVTLSAGFDTVEFLVGASYGF